MKITELAALVAKMAEGPWRIGPINYADIRSVDGKRAELPGSFATVAEAARAREEWAARAA